MILEVAILNVKPNETKNFERDFKKASHYIREIKGYKTHTLKRCIEQNNKYMLLVDWETLESHEVGFRTSQQYKHWKALLHHYYDPFPEVEHYETVVSF